MVSLIVRGNQLFWGDKVFPCAVGKNGFSEQKREGDNCTPLGTFALRECWFRPDKLGFVPESGLLLRDITPYDGWCDAPSHINYNMHVRLPFEAHHELLWREDDCYDVMVPLGYNDGPILPGWGSAIFLHVAKPGYSGTEGCVALSRDDLLAIVAQADESSTITIEKP